MWPCTCMISQKNSMIRYLPLCTDSQSVRVLTPPSSIPSLLLFKLIRIGFGIFHTGVEVGGKGTFSFLSILFTRYPYLSSLLFLFCLSYCYCYVLCSELCNLLWYDVMDGCCRVLVLWSWVSNKWCSLSTAGHASNGHDAKKAVISSSSSSLLSSLFSLPSSSFLPHLIPSPPHLSSPLLTSPLLTFSHFSSPHLTLPLLSSPHLTSPLLTFISCPHRSSVCLGKTSHTPSEIESLIDSLTLRYRGNLYHPIYR